MGFLDRFKKEKEQLKTEKISNSLNLKSVDLTEKKIKKEIAVPVEDSQKEKKEIKKKKRENYHRQEGIIIRPHMTEKTAKLASEGKYVFLVHPEVNRLEVKMAVKMNYGVHPKRVQIQNTHGKNISFRRMIGKRSSFKKAIVTLLNGEKIEIFEAKS
jgi:large subunit ribosomal protein L23